MGFFVVVVSVFVFVCGAGDSAQGHMLARSSTVPRRPHPLPCLLKFWQGEGIAGN